MSGDVLARLREVGTCMRLALTWWERCDGCGHVWPVALMRHGAFVPDTHFTTEHQEWWCPRCR